MSNPWPPLYLPLLCCVVNLTIHFSGSNKLRATGTSLSRRRCGVRMRGKRERPGKQLKRPHATAAVEMLKNPRRGRLSPTTPPASRSGSMSRKPQKSNQLLRKKHDTRPGAFDPRFTHCTVLREKLLLPQSCLLLHTRFFFLWQPLAHPNAGVKTETSQTAGPRREGAQERAPFVKDRACYRDRRGRRTGLSS